MVETAKCQEWQARLLYCQFWQHELPQREFRSLQRCKLRITVIRKIYPAILTPNLKLRQIYIPSITWLLFRQSARVSETRDRRYTQLDRLPLLWKSWDSITGLLWWLSTLQCAEVTNANGLTCDPRNTWVYCCTYPTYKYHEVSGGAKQCMSISALIPALV